MALGSFLAIGALAVLAIGGAALLWRARQPAPGSDEWFYKQGIIPLITDANRKALESRAPSKNLTGGKFGDVVGYFAPEVIPPKTVTPSGPPTPAVGDPAKRYEIDRLPELPSSANPDAPSTFVYMTPDGLISSLSNPVRVSQGAA